MSFHKTFEEARQSFKPMSRGKRIKRGRIKSRFNRKPSVDGDSGREVREDCDELVRKILHATPTSRTGEVCFIVGCYQSENLHVSHYIKRGVLATRWRLDNCHLMCDPHNEQHNYHANLYRQAMNLWYGPERAEELERIAKENPRVEYVDLLTIRDDLRSELA